MTALKNLIIPTAILCGSLLIAAAIFFKDYGPGAQAPALGTTGQPAQPQQQPAPQPPGPIQNADASRPGEFRHLYGAASAPITIVEFSDLECPFCARLHPTLKRMVDESNGGINWEYRHLPLPGHVNAEPAAIASECVASLAGPEAFQTYIEVLLANIGKANAAFLKAEAGKLGVAAAAYDTCIQDPAMATLVRDDKAAASRLGGSGTPYSLVVNNATKTAYPVTGAVPYEQWQTILSQVK